MILFTRVESRDFRVLFHRCVAGRPRGPAPPVAIQIKDSTRIITATTVEGVILTHTSPVPKEQDDFVVGVVAARQHGWLVTPMSSP